MKHILCTCVILLCIVSVAFADTVSHSDNDTKVMAKRKISDGQTTPYQPALRQNDVLFVEDGSGYSPPTTPDPVWDSLLTQILGAGNFGWFGPTVDPLENGPDLTTMQSYDLVIWHNYDQWDNLALTQTDQDNIADYLTGGGKVWLISQDGLYSGIPYWWMDTYFHLDTAYEDYGGGIDSLHIHGLAEIDCFSMISVCDYETNPFWADELVPDTLLGCHAVLEDTINDAVVGIFYPGFGEWQTAFWAADARDATFSTYWPTVIDIATGMLTAFGVVGVEEAEAQTPAGRLMLNVHPDPFVRTATISFNVPSDNHVALKIYNMAGQHIATLMDDSKPAGQYSATWNRRDASGAEVSNGVYFVRLTCGEISSTHNIVVAR
jgi:hypothetical protein